MRFLLALAILVLPLAAAGPAPAVHYLADDGSPLETGAMQPAAPAKNESSQRLVTAGVDGPTAWFATPIQEGRIAGPVFLGLWTTANPVVQGDLNASLWLEADGERSLLASQRLDVAIDPSQVPEPTALIPPDPSDPEGAAFYVAGQLLPLIMDPPLVFDLGAIDVQAPADASLLLGLELQGDPIAIGASMIQYDATTSPSFLYVPWYAPDPPPSTSSSTSSSPSPSSSSSSSPSPSGSATSSPSSSAEPEADEDAPEEDSPGAGFLAVLAAIGLAAYVIRRR